MHPSFLKARTVTLKKNVMLYDIDQLSLALSKSAGQNARQADNIATDTSEDTETFTRLMDARVAELKSLLAKYITSLTQASGDNTLVTANYVFNLTFTTETEDNTLDSIIKLMHDYVVKATLSDWYTENNVGPAQNLLTLAQADMARINELILYKPIPDMQ